MTTEHRFKVGDLPDDEGSVEVVITKKAPPFAQEVELLYLSQANLRHSKPCDGEMKVIEVTDQKAVLVCRNCNYRLPVPPALNTILGLDDHLRELRAKREGG